MAKFATYDYLLKLLLIGDSSVGKSCILQRFCDDTFCTRYISTIGIDFKIRTVEMEGKKIKLQIWDTAGQERFRTITTAYYRNAMGILLVFDITDERSFNNIKTWIRNIESHASENVVKLLVGNKNDQEQARVIPVEKAQALAKEYDIEYIETSAKIGTNVEAAFLKLAGDVKRKLLDPKAASPGSAGAGAGGAGGTGANVTVGSSSAKSGSRSSSCCKGARMEQAASEGKAAAAALKEATTAEPPQRHALFPLPPSYCKVYTDEHLQLHDERCRLESEVHAVA